MALVTPVHVAVRGRARVAVAGLRHGVRLKTVLEGALPRVPGIRFASASVWTGTCLVHFADSMPLATVLVTIERIVAGRSDDAPFGAATCGAAEVAAPAPASVPGRNGDADWHAIDVPEVLSRQGSVARSGLSSEDAAARLVRYGLNRLAPPRPRSGWSILAGQFLNLPVGLLVGSSILSILTGGIIDAAAILCVVGLNAVFGYATEGQAERTIASLSETGAQKALVRRNGQGRWIAAEAVVPGDVLLLQPGVLIAADARVVAAEALMVDESVLTGESLPVAKRPRRLVADVPLAERRNMLYKGTAVTGGAGLAIVVATGMASEVGRIQALVGTAHSPQTPLQRQLDGLGAHLVWVSLGLCSLVLVAGLLRRFPMFSMVRTAISLAIAAVPEGLPTVATTTLALGIRGMRRHQVLIRRLTAVEALGAVQVMCFDKTGTLTENRMSVVAAAVGARRYRLLDGRPLDGGGRPPDADADARLERLLTLGALSNQAEVRRAGDAVRLTGSPTECALVQACLDAGVDVVELRRRHPVHAVNQRSEGRRYEGTLHGREDGSRLVAVKGDPAEILSLSRWCLEAGERRLLTEVDRAAIERQNAQMADEALRVLGVAYANTWAETVAQALDDGLVWVGLVGMADPTRRGMAELMRRFQEAGVRTVMITGDQSTTAYAVAKPLNLAAGRPIQILDSAALQEMRPELRSSIARKADVFARVSPAYKLEIVRALQNDGTVVAMTGDGVNDSPALKAADVGVAMGTGGSDVARQVADVVLEDDDLHTMAVAIARGRTTYANIRKALHYLLATNLSEIVVTVAGTAIGVRAPLTPMQLLWINLITDVFPALGLAVEPPETDVLRQPPRNPRQPIVSGEDFVRLAEEGAVISAGALGVGGYALLRYGPSPQLSTMTALSLISAQLLHALSCRSETHGLFVGGRMPANRALTGAVTASLAAQLLAFAVPPLRRLLGFQPLGLVDAAVTLLGGTVPYLITEARKAAAAAHGASRPAPGAPPRRPGGNGVGDRP